MAQIQGVYIAGTTQNGAAEAAGIKVGDVVIAIAETKVNSTSELQEQISRYRPNDKIQVTIKRENKEKQIQVTLRNMEGTTKITSGADVFGALGAQFADLTNNEKSRLGINSGIKVAEINAGKLKEEGVLKGFIITKVNNRPISTVDDLKQVLISAKGILYIEGIYPNGVIAYYTLGID